MLPHYSQESVILRLWNRFRRLWGCEKCCFVFTSIVRFIRDKKQILHTYLGSSMTAFIPNSHSEREERKIILKPALWMSAHNWVFLNPAKNNYCQLNITTEIEKPTIIDREIPEFRCSLSSHFFYLWFIIFHLTYVIILITDMLPFTCKKQKS